MLLHMRASRQQQRQASGLMVSGQSMVVRLEQVAADRGSDGVGPRGPTETCLREAMAYMVRVTAKACERRTGPRFRNSSSPQSGCRVPLCESGLQTPQH